MKKILLFMLIMPSLALADISDWFNRGVDVEGRMLASTQTPYAYFSILGMSAPVHYSQLKTPIKKNVIAYAVNKNFGGWRSACYSHTVDCLRRTIKLNKVKYYDERQCRGERLKRMSSYDKDLKNFSLPANVRREIYNVACIMGM